LDLTLFLGEDTCSLLTQISTLRGVVTEAHPRFLSENTVHPFPDSSVVGLGTPVAIANPPSTVANPALDSILKAIPGIGATISQIAPDPVCLVLSLAQTIIDIGMEFG
jgi:hypothetical protein